MQDVRISKVVVCITLHPGLVELFGWSFGGSVVGLGLSEQKKQGNQKEE
jgi:hypothetical protein